ncbi:hypothetical protein L208DRAFT_1322149, partial [Tricholoma matsutake]
NNDNSIVTVEQPPNHEVFQGLLSSTWAKGSPLLERRLRDMKAIQNSMMTATMPVIQLYMPGGAPQNGLGPPGPIPAAPNAEKLLTCTKLGPDLSLGNFCWLYDVSDDILVQLKEHGYQKMKTFKHITISQLHEMSFKHGKIASLQDAVEEWVEDTEQVVVDLTKDLLE